MKKVVKVGIIILAVIIMAVIGILRIIIPYALTKLGVSAVSEGVNIVLSCLRIALIAVVIIVVVIIVFQIIACLLGWAGGFNFSLRPR